MIQKASIKEAEILCKQDPVRPNIPYQWRVQACWNEIFYLESNYYSTSEDRYIHIYDAVLCVAHLNDIPTTETELMEFDHGSFSIFYTVWSNRKGQGRQIIFDVMDLFKSQNPPSQRYVTLSPKTEMAMKFHLSNGASLIRENKFTNNFEYFLKKT